MEQKSENQAVIELVQKLMAPTTFDLNTEDLSATVVAVPSGVTLQSVKRYLDEYLPRPERKKGTTTLSTLDAFTAYVNRHKQAESVVFLDDSGAAPKLVAIFNAHGHSDGPNNGEPDWQDHRAHYSFPLADEWKAWTSELPESMTQVDFAAFLEERIGDVRAPSAAGEKTLDLLASLGVQAASPARLLELSRGLAVNVESRVSAAVNLGTGEGSITYAEEHKGADGVQLKIPGAFVIGIPVFKLGPAYVMAVRLRYRARDGRVTWQLAVHRTEEVFEHAVAEAESHVAEKTGLPVFRGTVGS